MLTCPKCGISKEESQFYKNKNRKTGYNSYCIDCLKQSINTMKVKYSQNRPAITELTCSRCNKTKSIEGNYFAHPKYKTGYYPICIACQKETSKTKEKVAASYQRHYDKVLKPRLEENTKKLFELLGNHCIDCGMEATLDNFVAFDLHHLDPDTKKFEVNAKRLRLIWDLDIRDEIKKCVLLCACCHRLRHK